MRRLFARWFGWRYVLLEKHDRNLFIVRAHWSESGWIARWIGNNDQWSILNPDGTTGGTTLVKRWYPFLGWQDSVVKPAPDPRLADAFQAVT